MGNKNPIIKNISEASINRILQKLNSLSDKEKISFLKEQTPPFPRYLYKYRAISNDTSKERIKQIAIDSKFFLSSPESFNDPFDMKCKWVIEGSAFQTRERLKNLFKSLGNSRREIDEKLPRAVVTLRENPDKILGDSVKKAVNSSGVLSLSKIPHNILMWSHYSDCSKGICLQFDVIKDPDTFMKAARVRYNDTYPVINWLENNIQNPFREALLQKSTHWSYEQEHRIIEPGSANAHLSFKPESLVGIIFGVSISQESIDFITELLEERFSKGWNKPNLIKCHTHKEKYALLLYKYITSQ
ncbi:MAG: DUF2971 domain-containing protein [Gammaproteobacteria bacterium]|nr:DUF2971 domain-containing protein [Gammaproteobacteria bacterium]